MANDSKLVSLEDLKVAYDDLDGKNSELKSELSQLFTEIIAESNVECTYENGTFTFTENVSSGFPYAFFNRNEGTFSQTSEPGSSWIILAEYENGVIIANMYHNNGYGYYLSYDLSVMTGIYFGSIVLRGYDVTAKVTDSYFELSANGVTKQCTYSQFASSISDTFVAYRLGYARANNSSYNTPCNIAFTIPDLVGATKSGARWDGKTGDFLGDSLTAQNQFTAKMSSLYGITVNNYGVSGTTISNKVTSDYFSSRVSSMSDTCDFVFVLGGTNDWGLGATLGTKTDMSLSTFYGGLYNLFSALRTKFPTKPIFVSTIPQRDWTATTDQSSGIDSNSNGNSLEEFNAAITYMAHRYGCVVIDAYGESGIIVDNITTYTSDRLHFNDAGGIRYATFIKDCMERHSAY